jgi:hypothetical protein
MENRFQGLVVFLIGLSDLFVAYAIGQAENLGSQVSAPTSIIWALGIIFVLAGVIWAIIGDKIELKAKWTG